MIVIFSRQKKTEAKLKNKETLISRDLLKNQAYIEKQYSHGVNMDFVSRPLDTATGRYHLFFYSTTVDTKQLSNHVISPILSSKKDVPLPALLAVPGIESLKDMKEVEDALSSGYVVILKEGNKEAYAAKIPDLKHRSIEKAENEKTVRGPKESFTESLDTNISIIRKRLPSKDTVVENVKIGARPSMSVSLVYVRDLTNPEVLENIRKRLKSITVDNVCNIEILEQFIEERPLSLFPTMLYSERPDNASNYIEAGFIVLLMDNSSSCLIAPATIWSFFHSPEDRYLRWIFGNFSRFIRAAAYLITLFASAVYIAITNFHSQLLPIDLLLAIAASRERVPMPIFFEVLIMEFAFELIREAGIRIPSPLGPTIGIVGALILGQAAVQANIVSPIVVILVALSGLSSFTAANYSINHTLRISRFIFICASYLFGFMSLLGAVMIWMVYLVSIKSFGVPYTSPATPTTKSTYDTFFRILLKKERWRPAFLKPQDKDKQ